VNMTPHGTTTVIIPVVNGERLAGILDRDPSLGVVMGTQRLLAEPGATLPYWVPGRDLDTIDPEELPRPTGSLVTRRSTYDVVGLYDDAMIHAEDTDWFLRAQDLGVAWALIPDVVLIRRLHGANLTNDTESQRRSMFEVLQRRMTRRRGA
jgi:hypothetical protein